MRRALALLAAVVCLAAGSAAQAQTPVVDMLQKYCVTTGGGSATVIDAASRDGFVRFPKAMMKELANLPFQKLEIRAKLIDGEMQIVLTGSISDPEAPGMVFDICGVGVMPGSPGATAEMRAWLGVAPMRDQTDNMDVYMFVDGPKGRRSLDDLNENESRRAMRAGAIHLAGGEYDPEADMTVLFYGSMRPTT